MKYSLKEVDTENKYKIISYVLKALEEERMNSSWRDKYVSFLQLVKYEEKAVRTESLKLLRILNEKRCEDFHDDKEEENLY